VLIGDKDQLSSVEAGSVLGELCARAAGGHYLPQLAAWLADATGDTVPNEKLDAQGRKLDQAVAMLRFSHRFDGSSGIGRLALAVSEGQASAVTALLEQPPADLAYLELTAAHGDSLVRLIVDGDVDREHEKQLKGQTRVAYGHYLSRVAAEPQSADTQVYDSWAAKVL